MEKKMVKIVLDKERNLYFNLNSLEIIEELTGKTIDKITENLNMKSLKAIVYAGLIHEDKSLTVEAVGDMIGFNDISRVSEAIGEAFGGLK
ncbi:hypothetical protein [uncultured Clostridium sp.]|uniref:hypothetical protein n=1 Tax=uncultured Clostridium sp. TaxID=59620 RepID=UPI0026F3DCDE|nr:hypothetical protein [uncultured Clostridium sp.]